MKMQMYFLFRNIIKRIGVFSLKWSAFSFSFFQVVVSQESFVWRDLKGQKWEVDWGASQDISATSAKPIKKTSVSFEIEMKPWFPDWSNPITLI